MFQAEIIWRGIVYTILMLFAKLLTGLWLMRIDFSEKQWPLLGKIRKLKVRRSEKALKRKGNGKEKEVRGENTENHEMSSGIVTHPSKEPKPAELNSSATPSCKQALDSGNNPIPDIISNTPDTVTTEPSKTHPPGVHESSESQKQEIKKPLSLYPAAMLGTASMFTFTIRSFPPQLTSPTVTARGEIGFLIASIAETSGVFSSSSRLTEGSSDIYLVVIWAVVLCTIIGPLSVGLLVKRIRRLQYERGKDSSRADGRGDPLGIWGFGGGG